MKPLALTIGEPAGIGPDIVLQLFAHEPDLFSADRIVVVGNKKLLRDRSAILGITDRIHKLTILDLPLQDAVTPGQLNKKNAEFVMQMLTLAAQETMNDRFSGIVTAPIHKGILNDAGFDIKGHTDFFSKYTQSPSVMMLMNTQMKVALLTDHIPLQSVAQSITEESLSRCLTILIQALSTRFHLHQPRILVCGLNPHAGENGHLGTEEKEILIPVIEKFRKNGHKIIGPIGADVAFTPKYLAQADVILSLYHDQGLPVIKYVGFHETINVTLGLPFVRTSVDHGTALDMAGSTKVNTTSLKNAIFCAEQQVTAS